MHPSRYSHLIMANVRVIFSVICRCLGVTVTDQNRLCFCQAYCHLAYLLSLVLLFSVTWLTVTQPTNFLCLPVSAVSHLSLSLPPFPLPRLCVSMPVCVCARVCLCLCVSVRGGLLVRCSIIHSHALFHTSTLSHALSHTQIISLFKHTRSSSHKHSLSLTGRVPFKMVLTKTDLASSRTLPGIYDALLYVSTL